MLPSGYITVKKSSEISMLSRKQIQKLLRDGTVQGIKIERDYLVVETSLRAYMANRPRPGPKPKKKV